MNQAPLVIVVGAGPVGLTAAVAASGKGLRVIVFEAEGEDRTRPGSRAIFLHKDPIALIDSFVPGVADRIFEESMLWTRNRYTFRGRTFFDREFRRSTIASREYGASQSQRTTELILMAVLKERGVPTRWNSEVTGVATSDKGVRLTLRDGTVHDADYVIGADGARSGVRKALGIEMEGVAGKGAYNVIVDVAELPDRPTPYELHFHYDYPPVDYRNLLMIPMKDAWRLGLTLKPGDDVAWMSSEAGVKAWLPKVMDPRYAQHITWISTYKYHQLVASSFCDANRRVLLAGEAAHLFAPWGGRGLNSGIVDSCEAVLAIIKAAAAPDQAGAFAAIDHFDRERREAGLYNKRAAQYALNLLAPSSTAGKLKRLALGWMAPYVKRAAIHLATGPNAGYSVGRPGKGIY